MTDTVVVPEIYKAIEVIQAKVGAIPKNGVGPANKGSFAFIKAEDVLDAIHAQLVENHVIVIPTIRHSKHETVRDGGRAYTTAAVEVDYQYVSTVDGSSIVTTSVGEGSDIGSDTATRKAATMALKISHLHMFTIPNTDINLDDEGYEPAAGAAASEPKSNRAVSKAKSTSTSAKADSLEKIRAKVKAAGQKKGLTPAGINELGDTIDSDWFANADALQKLLTEIEKLEG